MLDYYNLLGVRSTARPEELRAAFRRKAKEAHPDAHPHLGGAEKEAMQRRFIQLAHAYEILADPAQRAAYDRKLRAARAGAARARPAGGRASAAGAAPGAGGGAGTGGGAGGARGGPRRGARPGPRPGRSGRPPTGEGDPDLDELMQEVGDLLQRFGLDMRMQFAGMLDNMFEWALSVFLDVVGALDSAHRKERESAPGQGAAAANEAPPRGEEREDRETESGTARPAPRDFAPGSPPEEPDFDSELQALKQQVRSAKRQAARARPTQQSVEEELARIKAGMAGKTSGKTGKEPGER